jgi:hypothetical protein
VSCQAPLIPQKYLVPKVLQEVLILDTLQLLYQEAANRF